LPSFRAQAQVFHFDNLVSIGDYPPPKGGIAENSFIVFLIEWDGVEKLSRKGNRSLNVSLGALCAFA
jgi:hypothetical protein